MRRLQGKEGKSLHVMWRPCASTSSMPMFKAKIANEKNEERRTGASILHGATDKMDPSNPPTPSEHGITEEADTLLNQDMG